MTTTADDETYDLSTLTDEAIAEFDTATLRVWAEKVLPSYSQRTSIASFTLDLPLLITHPNALSQLGKTIEVLKSVYADRDPQVLQHYGSLEIRIWEGDDNLRASLRYGRKDD